MDTQALYLLGSIAVVLSPFFAYGSAMQATTLWLGRRIEAMELIKITPASFASATQIQTIISPSSQAFFIRLMSLGMLGILIYGCWVRWWVGPAALVATIMLNAVLGHTVFPKALSWWIQRVSVCLQNRISNLRASNDQERAEKLEIYIPILGKLEEQASQEQISVTRI